MKKHVGMEAKAHPDSMGLGPALTRKTEKWWRRVGDKERGFHYIDADEKRIASRADLDRIASLVIPPAWIEVRISPYRTGAIQAIGVDTSGRAQYLYHARFAEKRQREKFSRLRHFGEHLPLLRKATRRHIAQKDLSKEHVLAVVVRLIHTLYFRLGSEKSVQRYKTFGITTLRSQHVSVRAKSQDGPPSIVEFHFKGKHHVEHHVTLHNKKLAAILDEMKSMPGSRLFQYRGADNKLHPIKASDVNAYIKSHTQPDFSAKDFRTWGATLLAASHLAEIGVARTMRESKKKVVAAVKHVAVRLGNTPSVCRGSYIHPMVIKAYEMGRTIKDYRNSIRRRKSDMGPEESALLAMLRSA